MPNIRKVPQVQNSKRIIQTQERIVQVPQIVAQEVVRQEMIPQTAVQERIVEVPQVQTVEKIVPVPQVKTNKKKCTSILTSAWISTMDALGTAADRGCSHLHALWTVAAGITCPERGQEGP